jgi:hypothetical protein
MTTKNQIKNFIRSPLDAFILNEALRTLRTSDHNCDLVRATWAMIQPLGGDTWNVEVRFSHRADRAVLSVWIDNGEVISQMFGWS